MLSASGRSRLVGGVHVLVGVQLWCCFGAQTQRSVGTLPKCTPNCRGLCCRCRNLNGPIWPALSRGRVGTLPGCDVLSPDPDHPHASGEHQFSILARGPTDHPHASGEHGNLKVKPCARRTIPTRVGSTIWIGNAAYLNGDHPHASGEHYQFRFRAYRRDGPSPREWGALCRKWARPAAMRTIPTRVGSTPSRRKAVL